MFVRLPPAAGSEPFIVAPAPLPAGSAAAPTLGSALLPASGRAVAVGSGAATGQAFFFNLGAATVAAAPLPSDVQSLCPAAGKGTGAEDLSYFANSGGAMAAAVYGNGCARFLVLDGGRQTVTPQALAGIVSMGNFHGLNNFVFAPGRTDLAAEFTRLVTLQDGARLAQIVPADVGRLDPAPRSGYPVRAFANEVYVSGTVTSGRSTLFVFRLDTAAATAIQAPENTTLSTWAWASRQPNRVFMYGTGANAAPQIIVFDVAARTASAVNLPGGTLTPFGFNPDSSLVLFDHRDGVLAVRLE